MVRAIRNRSSFSGVVSCSAVSKVNTRFSAKLEKDRKISRGSSTDHKESVTSQGLTPFYLFFRHTYFLRLKPNATSALESKMVHYDPKPCFFE